MENVDVWVLGDPRRGIEAQYEALTSGLGVAATVKHFSLPFPWSHLPPSFSFKPLCVVNPKLTPPWPDIVISVSRVSTALAVAIKKASGGKTFLIHLQKPQLSPNKFDLIIAPEHDQLEGPNVISTLGSLNNLSPEVLEEASKEIDTNEVRKPLIGVLVGGNSKHQEFKIVDMIRLVSQIKAFHEIVGGTLFVVPSRRTPPNLQKMLSILCEDPSTFIWGGEDPNPYRPLLGSADAFIVTNDSVNMMTEAAATGKPIFAFEFGKLPRKFRRFHKSLSDQNLVHNLTEYFDIHDGQVTIKKQIDFWSPIPLFELPRVVEEVKTRYEEFRRGYESK